MKKAYWLSTILVLVLMFAAAYMMSRPTAEVYSQAATQIGSDEAPQQDNGPDAVAVPFSPNNFPGTQPVYFSPSDNDGTATVVILGLCLGRNGRFTQMTAVTFTGAY